MLAPRQQPVFEVGDYALRVCGGIALATVAELQLAGAPTAPAAISVLLVALVAGMTAGRRAAIPAAIFACYVFGDHHLADSRGVLGSSSVAVTFLAVQGLAIGCALLGHAWWDRLGARAQRDITGRTGSASPPRHRP